MPLIKQNKTTTNNRHKLMPTNGVRALGRAGIEDIFKYKPEKRSTIYYPLFSQPCHVI
jgi:hypothetical protein